jgi:hypothetical protein
MTVSRGQVLARCFVLALLLGFAAMPLGCGGENLVTVSGKVMVGDQPLTTGNVFFDPDKTKGNTSTARPVGEINASGEYTLKTNGKPGAALGWYKVTIVATAPPGTSAAEMSKPLKYLVNMKYTDVKTTDLQKEVVASGGAYELKLSP